MVPEAAGDPVTGSAFRCRSCGSADIVPVLSLGRMPLANALLTEGQLEGEEDTYSLDLVLCRSCTLVQITETVSPERLFREYLYFSSFSDTFLGHAQALVGRIVGERRLGRDHLVIEVGSNDGYLLQYYRDREVPVLGIEPATSVAQVAREERGIPTLCEFFGEELARQLHGEGRGADVMHAHNVLAHVADLNGFVAGLRLLLKPDGMAVIEVPYVKDMIDRCEFDTIYHEHLCYFSVTALEHLLRRHALALRAVERLPIHGGSLRLFVVHADDAQPDDSVSALRREEEAWGVDRPDFYEGFAAHVRALGASLRALLEQLAGNGSRIAGYGAAAKATVLLNFAGLSRDLVSFVVDRSPHKQGRFIPGPRVPVCPPERLLETQPDYVLLLAWNLAEEVLAQQLEYRRRGGRFIIPVPEVRIVS